MLFIFCSFFWFIYIFFLRDLLDVNFAARRYSNVIRSEYYEKKAAIIPVVKNGCLVLL